MFKTVLGVIIVVTITNSLIRLGLRSGASSLVLGTILLMAVAIDVRWLNNRAKLLARSYVSPPDFALPPLQNVSRAPDRPYAINELLSDAEPIAVGQVDGPEDVILDAEGNLYCGSRDGDIIRFLAPDHKAREVYVHMGGSTSGLAFDREGSLLVCEGMGLYKVTTAREVIKLSDETTRSWLSIVDDSRMRLADDLDIAPDGRVFFSEATIRYEMHDRIIDALDGRGNGRIICYDARDGSSRTVLSGRITAPDNLVLYRGQVLFSSGPMIHRLDPATGGLTEWRRRVAEVTALAAVGEMLAIAMADGSVILSGGRTASSRPQIPASRPLPPAARAG